MSIRSKAKKAPPADADVFDANQLVAYNLRLARVLRSMKQEDLAAILTEKTGETVSAASVSAMERSWQTDRRKLFNAHEIALFADVLGVPITWFFMPPADSKGWGRRLAGTGFSLRDLVILIWGNAVPHSSDRMHVRERLDELTAAHPIEARDLAARMALGRDAADQGRKFFDLDAERTDAIHALLRSDELRELVDGLSERLAELRRMTMSNYVLASSQAAAAPHPEEQEHS